MKIINQVPVADDISSGTVQKDSKTYYVCSVCGRLSFRKTVSHKRIYCHKHYSQIKRFGKPMDNNPRTILDRNEIRIDGDVAYMDIYNDKCEVVATAIIDAEDVDKVRYTKWKLSGSGYVMNSLKHGASNVYLSRHILDTDEFVNYINHNPLDNRKANLSVVTKSQNSMNTNFKGVSHLSNGKYYAHIKRDQKTLNLGVYVDEAEALFARWYAETLLFGEYRYPKEKPNILASREQDIVKYVNRKVQRL